jgi:hypothetical protein
MSYLATYTLCIEEQAIRKIAVAAAQAAFYISAEAENVDQHALRMALVVHAGPKLSDYMAFARELSLFYFTQNPTLTVDSSDQDYSNAIAGIWNVYAAALVARGVLTVA